MSLFVKSAGSADWPRALNFQQTFKIGRSGDAGFCIKNEYVSRYHVEVSFANGRWTVVDLNSGNGLFVNGQRVERALIEKALTIRLGVEGPFVEFELELPREVALPPPPAVRLPVPTASLKPKNVDRYFGKLPASEPLGEQTMMIREAFTQVQKKQKRKYGGVMAALAVCVLAASGYAWFLHLQVAKQRGMAVDLFYTTKNLDLQIANVEKMVRDSN